MLMSPVGRPDEKYNFFARKGICPNAGDGLPIQVAGDDDVVRGCPPTLVGITDYYTALHGHVGILDYVGFLPLGIEFLVAFCVYFICGYFKEEDSNKHSTAEPATKGMSFTSGDRQGKGQVLHGVAFGGACRVRSPV